MDPNEATNNKKWKKWRMHGGRFSEKSARLFMAFFFEIYSWLSFLK